MNKFFKNQKGISVISLMLIIIIVAIGIIFARKSIKLHSIESMVLTKYNLEDNLDKYYNLKKDSDDIIYVGYAIMYYSTLGYMSDFFNSEVSKPNDYTQIYGKTIKELKEKGEVLMRKNNTTPQDFKENMDIMMDILTIK